MTSPAVSRTRSGFALPRLNSRTAVMILYLLFLTMPVYWLVNMSLKANSEILSSFTLWPREPTLDNYRTILTDPSWYMGYVNSLIYVVMNTVILSVAAALPAAYAFSRYSFLGDKHLFFWLLDQPYGAAGGVRPAVSSSFIPRSVFSIRHIAVALAHCLFNVPLAVWILEGFMRGVPREIDETAYIDGYSLPEVFRKDIHAVDFVWNRRGGLLLLHVLLGRTAAESRTLTSVDAKPIAAVMTRTVSASGLRLGRSGRRGRAYHRSRRARHLFRPQPHRQGLRPGEVVMAWMAWTVADGDLLRCHRTASFGLHSAWQSCFRKRPASAFLRIATTRGDRLFISACSVRPSSIWPGSAIGRRIATLCIDFMLHLCCGGVSLGVSEETLAAGMRAISTKSRRIVTVFFGSTRRRKK